MGYTKGTAIYSFEVCEEMEKLRKILDEKGIKWEDKSEDWESQFKDMGMRMNHWMCRTHFTLKDDLISVINGAGSYGGFSYWDNKNRGLLELMCSRVNDGEPEGFLRAEQVIEMLENEYGEIKG